MSALTWDNVKHLCYPGTTTEVECFVPRRSSVYYVLFAEVEDGETYLTLHDGSQINARDYQAPLGWLAPDPAGEARGPLAGHDTETGR